MKARKNPPARLGRVLLHVQHKVVVALVLADALNLLLSGAARQARKAGQITGCNGHTGGGGGGSGSQADSCGQAALRAAEPRA